MSSVEEVATGFSIQGTLSGVSESASFDAILGFDGFLTVLSDDPVLDGLAESLAAYIDVPDRVIAAATALVIVIVVVVIIAVVCTIGIIMSWFGCEAKPASDPFPFLDRPRPILATVQAAVV